MRASTFGLTFISLLAAPAFAEENFSAWEPLKPVFESTGGGGVMIIGYDPIVKDGKCRTDFTAQMPDGAKFFNEVEFDAVPLQGGILCENGRWRAKDGSANGTTPFRVFIKDGVKRGAPI